MRTITMPDHRVHYTFLWISCKYGNYDSRLFSNEKGYRRSAGAGRFHKRAEKTFISRLTVPLIYCGVK